MEIAVTGHSGFIGTYLCNAIEKKGWKLIRISNVMESVKCDRVYHLACPSSTQNILDDPIGIIDVIIDGTRKASKICPKAQFINISSMGALYTTKDSKQSCYNTAKRLMELYLKYDKSVSNTMTYRLPSVYGVGMGADCFIQRCIDGKAYKPKNYDKIHYIGSIDSIIESLIYLKPLKIEVITLGEIYDRFSKI
jgi:nucleoside-diphosphate-sugar epimerase